MMDALCRRGQRDTADIRLNRNMGPYIVAIILILIVVATSMALWWWRLSAQIAPYEDELERRRARDSAPTDEQVVIVSRKPEGR